MLDSICTTPVDLPGTHRKLQNAKWKILANRRIRSSTMRFEVWCSTNWANRALMKVVPFKWSIYKHVLPMPMYTFIHWYRFENNEVERILSCKCTVLCYIFEYSYYVQRAKRCKSSVFAFHLQIPDQLESLIVFCMLKANTGLVCLFAICTI